jgi:predicted GNAT family N-acyltransferase
MNIEKQFFTQLNNDLRSIRELVFVEEQGFTDEFDDVDIDNTSFHLLLYIEGKPVATGRLYQKAPFQDVYIIGRLAVLSEYRNLNLGSIVLTSLEDKAKHCGATSIELSAQCRVQGFYEKHGYRSINNSYLDGDCPHILMIKNI